MPDVQFSRGNVWPATTNVPEITNHAVHLWAIHLGDEPYMNRRKLSVLTPDERERAARFHFEGPRSRFVTARVAIRLLLAKYLQIAPESIRFKQDPLGKPRFDRSMHSTSVYFNLSHSANLAILAVAKACELGVDVERFRHVAHLTGITRRYFHPTEAEYVLQGDADLQQLRFFECWTGKEAVIKALGCGLQFPLQSFHVPFGRGCADWCVYPESRHTAAGRCWLHPFTPLDEHVGALASFVIPEVVQCYTFSG